MSISNNWSTVLLNIDRWDTPSSSKKFETEYNRYECAQDENAVITKKYMNLIYYLFATVWKCKWKHFMPRREQQNFTIFSTRTWSICILRSILMDVTDYQNNENTMYQCTFRFLSKCYTINHNLKLRYLALN